LVDCWWFVELARGPESTCSSGRLAGRCMGLFVGWFGRCGRCAGWVEENRASDGFGCTFVVQSSVRWML
jgi:hypothetical protein